MGNQELLKDTISCIEACSFIGKPNCEQCKMGGPGFGFGCREQVRIQALGLLKWHAKELERLQIAINDRGKVVSALENCVAKPKCRDCYWDECGSMTESIEIPSGLAHAALDLLKEQESELIRLREKAENVVLKSSVNMQRFKYRLKDASDDEASDYIREHLKSDLIRACEKMGLIVYEESRTNVGGSAPMVSITATLRVHKPEVMKQDG